MNGVGGEPIWQMKCLICGGEIGEALDSYDIIYYHLYNLNFELFMYGLPMPNKYILYEPFIFIFIFNVVHLILFSCQLSVSIFVALLVFFF
jgi:hypothetical protein